MTYVLIIWVFYGHTSTSEYKWLEVSAGKEVCEVWARSYEKDAYERGETLKWVCAPKGMTSWN